MWNLFIQSSEVELVLDIIFINLGIRESTFYLTKLYIIIIIIIIIIICECCPKASGL